MGFTGVSVISPRSRTWGGGGGGGGSFFSFSFSFCAVVCYRRREKRSLKCQKKTSFVGMSVCAYICFSAFDSHGLNGALDSKSLAGIKEL